MKILSSLLAILIVFQCFLLPAGCVLGLDMAGEKTTANFQCLKSAGFDFVVIRGYRSLGILDAAATQSLINAKSAGFATDIYMFPCRGKSASDQVDQLVKGINSTLYDTIYIDVESNPSTGCSWNTHDHDSNCQFLMETINRLKFYGKKTGIYTTPYFWNLIFGSKTACPESAVVSIWYARYDKLPNFNDFTPIGGWEKPEMKQYDGDVIVCGLDVDKNYKP